MSKCTLPLSAAVVLAAALSAAPAAAQFYKGKTLTLLVNYGVGGNIDTEARILARHLRSTLPALPPS
jgi:tripartite-type tricarboxylate transporter receptor subunit TctC